MKFDLEAPFDFTEKDEETIERERLARIAENKDKPPVKIGWGIDYDYTKDEIYPMPECPVCGEMPYSTEECYFCGTKFIQDDPKLLEWLEDNGQEKEEIIPCFQCGGEMHALAVKRNGEWRMAGGECKNCGVRFIV